jgi:hypothetical protein
MNQALVDRIVQALLYEGYILYPYRPSVKNRQRWTFGGLYPQAYCTAQGGADSWTMQTECLVRGAQPSLDLTVRFLHLQTRQIGALEQPVRGLGTETPSWRPVESLDVDGRMYQSWQEASERAIHLDALSLPELAGEPRRHAFAFPSQQTTEPITNALGEVVGVIVREQRYVTGAVELGAERLVDDLHKLTVRVHNQSTWSPTGPPSRDDALLHSLLSTHTVLGVSGGDFVSLLDPPEPYRAFAAACRNIGTWPVLVGENGATDTMLSSPIILYDYPEVAPESPGDLYDATEIDEILTLRVLTLTDEEKRQAVALDPRAHDLLERTEQLAREQLLSLHGTLRGLRPAEEGSPHG